MFPLHHRLDATRNHPPGGSKGGPHKYMTRKVSWDPNVTVVELTNHGPPRSPPNNGPRNASNKSRELQRSPLHPLLSADSTNVIFDVRLAPAPSVTSSTTHSIAEPAVASGARHLRLVSREFPWTIDIENTKQSAVTCVDVFNALYAGLSATLTSSEWTLADEHKQESMQRANRARRGGGSVKRLRRIDWLGSRVYFKGLIRDDELCRSRLLPEETLWPETWVVKFGSRA